MDALLDIPFDAVARPRSASPMQWSHSQNSPLSSSLGHGFLFEAPEGRSAFQYEPLDRTKAGIRLLTVLPGDGWPIQCEIEHFDLYDEPQFTALSYQWGNETGAAPCLEINGHISNLKVRRNLALFLWTFRQRADLTETRLWIDALCIDQSNVLERNHQVAQMSKLYSFAEHTIVWLDDAKQSDSDRIRQDVLQRTYWTRTWIVQEFLLSRNVWLWFDGQSLNLEDFVQRYGGGSSSRLEGFLLDDGYREIPGQRLLQLKAQFDPDLGWSRNFSGSPSLFTLSQYFASSRCMETRDRIYALLGIVPDATRGSSAVKPDYDKSDVEVFIDVLDNQRNTHSIGEWLEYRWDFMDFFQVLLGISDDELIDATMGNRDAEREWLVSSVELQNTRRQQPDYVFMPQTTRNAERRQMGFRNERPSLIQFQPRSGARPGKIKRIPQNDRMSTVDHIFSYEDHKWKRTLFIDSNFQPETHQRIPSIAGTQPDSPSSHASNKHSSQTVPPDHRP